MHIESPEDLKAYLLRELGLISDNSDELTPYVMALLKKNMSNDSLRAHCADQLQVFLEEKTNTFVDRLFAYIENPTPMEAPETTQATAIATTKVDSPARDTKDKEPSSTREREARRDSHGGRDERRREYRRDGLDDEDRDYRRRGRASPDYRDESHRKRYREDERERPRYRDSHSRDSVRDRSDSHRDHRGRDFDDRRPRLKEPCVDFETRGQCVRGDDCPYDHGSNPIVLPAQMVPVADIPDPMATAHEQRGRANIATPFDGPRRPPPPRQPFTERPGPGMYNPESYNPDMPFDNFRKPGLPHPPHPTHAQHPHLPPPHHQHQVPLSQPPPHWRPMLDMRGMHPMDMRPIRPMDLRMLPPPPSFAHGMRMPPLLPGRPVGMPEDALQHQVPLLPAPPSQHLIVPHLPPSVQQKPMSAGQPFPGAPQQQQQHQQQPHQQQQQPQPLQQQSVTTEKKRFCFQFGKGECQRGASCKFSHDPSDAFAGKARAKGSVKRGCRLEVRGLPEDLNNIVKLNEHFSKFGAVVNIHVGVTGAGTSDIKSAVVEFRSALDATKAYNSEDAVFGKRFIRLIWPQEPSPVAAASAPGSVSATATHTSQEALKLGDAAVVPSIQPKLAIGGPPQTPGVQVVVVSASAPNALLAPSASPSINATAPADSASGPAPAVPTPVRRPPTTPARKSLGNTASSSSNSNVELEKQRELVSHLIQQQKALVDRLASSKTLSAEDRRKATEAIKSTMVLVERATASLKALAARNR